MSDAPDYTQPDTTQPDTTRVLRATRLGQRSNVVALCVSLVLHVGVIFALKEKLIIPVVAGQKAAPLLHAVLLRPLPNKQTLPQRQTASKKPNKSANSKPAKKRKVSPKHSPPPDPAVSVAPTAPASPVPAPTAAAPPAPVRPAPSASSALTAETLPLERHVSRPASQHVSMHLLSRMPHPRGQCKAVYPTRARRLGIEGMVQLHVQVLANGEVGTVRLLRGADYILEQAALQAIKKCRFSPPLRGTQPVATTIPYQFRFKLDG